MRQLLKTMALAGGAATMTFDQTDDEYQRPHPGLARNYIEIVSLLGEEADAARAEPTVGTYKSYVQQVPHGNWREIEDDGTVNAVDTGGDALADGAAVSSSFTGTPYAIKIVADSVDVATHFRVAITQYLA